MLHHIARLGSYVLRLCAALAAMAWAGPLVGQDAAEDAPLGQMTMELLTEDEMQRYVNTLPDILAHKSDPEADEDTVEYWEGMVAIAAEHGFDDYAEFVFTSATIATLLTGMDPITLEFTEPRVKLEENITYLTEFIEAAKAALDDEAGREPSDVYPPELLPMLFMLDELKAGRTLLSEKTDPQNILLIKTYFPEIVRNSSPVPDTEEGVQ